MSTITQFGKGVIKFGLTAVPDVSVECQVSNFAINAVPQTIQVPGTYCQGPSVAAQQSAFQIALSYLSDWGDADSLSQFMFDNDGSIVFYEFTPTDTTIPEAAGSCYAVAGTFGGPGDGLWVNASVLPCIEKPVLTPQV